VFKAPIHVNEASVQKSVPRRPLYRTILTLILIVAAISVPVPGFLVAGIAGWLLFMLWCGIPFRFVMMRMLLILPFGLFAVMFMPFVTSGEPMFHWLGFTATEEGMAKATLVLLKICSANLLLTYLIATTPLFDLIKSLRALGIPAVMIELISMMMRYFFLLAEEVRGMLKAQRSRGFRMDGWLWSRRTYKRFGELVGVLFLRAYSRSQRIYLSMSARGGFDFPGTESELKSSMAKNGGVADSEMKSGQLHEAMAIEVKGVSYRYGDIKALKDVSFSVSVGEKVALMGPNGAGKSTLISLLNGLEEPSKGTVSIFGTVVDQRNCDLLRRKIGVVYQDPDDQIFSTTVGEDVAFGPRNLGLGEEKVEERVHTALDSVGMLNVRARSPFELSYGQKRRVAIAGVLAMKPEILVLDEPMAFLDPKSRDGLLALLEGIHRSGLTILIATHDVDFAAEWADTVVVLKDGRLLRSGPTDLLFDEALIREADLHLPRLARPFRLLEGVSAEAIAGMGTGGATHSGATLNPKTVEQAAQMIWRLIMRRTEKPDIESKHMRDIN